MLRCTRLALVAVTPIVLVASGCTGTGDGRGALDTAAPLSAAATTGSIPDSALDNAAREVIAFLRGGASFDEIELADSVVLYVSPEGGGWRTVFQRDELRERSSWVVASGARSHPIAPPPGLTSLTTRVGRHFNCMEYPLASRFEELAHLPHVGVKLEPESGGNCLQTWNVTLVFDSTARPPRLAAVVYDQWEW